MAARFPAHSLCNNLLWTSPETTSRNPITGAGISDRYKKNSIVFDELRTSLGSVQLEKCFRDDNGNRELDFEDFEDDANMIEEYVDDESECSENETEDEDERLKRLFYICDRDKDGFIDREDVCAMCALLGMEESADDIIKELGLSGAGRGHISFDDFIRCRARLAPEIELQRNQEELSSNRNEASGLASFSTIGHFSLEQQQLQLEQPVSLFTLLERQYSQQLQEYLDRLKTFSNKSDNNDILHIANVLHMNVTRSLSNKIAAVQQEHIKSLTRLQEMQHEVITLKTSRAMNERRYEERLEEMTVHYEDRVTELSSVIAELRKKLDQRYSDVIREEEEDETIPTEQEMEGEDFDCTAADESVINPVDKTSSNFTIEQNKQQMNAVKVCPAHQVLNEVTISESGIVCRNNKKILLNKTELHHQQQQQQLIEVKQHAGPVTKVAELKKLQTGGDDSAIHGSQLTRLGLKSGKMVEHLVKSMNESCSLQEILQHAIQSNVNTCNGSTVSDNTVDGSSVAVNTVLIEKLREFEIDVERLQSRVDNLISQNEVTSLKLKESQARCDQLARVIDQKEIEQPDALAEEHVGEGNAGLIEGTESKVANNMESAILQMENAVLMQELMAIKEEKSELRAINYLLDKERKLMEERLKQKRVRPRSGRSRGCRQMAKGGEDLSDKSSIDDQAFIRSKAESRVRKPGERKPSTSNVCENIFKMGGGERLEEGGELTSGLDEMTQSYDQRLQQSAMFVHELKSANSALVAAYEKIKKKHEEKARRMERQMSALLDKHEEEMKQLRDKFASVQSQLIWYQQQHEQQQQSL